MDVELSGSQEPQLMVVLDRHTSCRAAGPASTTHLSSRTISKERNDDDPSSARA